MGMVYSYPAQHLSPILQPSSHLLAANCRPMGPSTAPAQPHRWPRLQNWTGGRALVDNCTISTTLLIIRYATPLPLACIVRIDI